MIPPNANKIRPIIVLASDEIKGKPPLIPSPQNATNNPVRPSDREISPPKRGDSHPVFDLGNVMEVFDRYPNSPRVVRITTGKNL
jgi:hypothetical protein